MENPGAKNQCLYLDKSPEQKIPPCEKKKTPSIARNSPHSTFSKPGKNREMTDTEKSQLQKLTNYNPTIHS